jgi:hypothetical protein
MAPQTLSHALSHLAARFSEYVPVLRAEVEEIVTKEGWTKAAVCKMFKLDSFLRETTRFTGFSAREPLHPLASGYYPILRRFLCSDATSKSDESCRIHFLRRRHGTIRMLSLRVVVHCSPSG